MAACLLLTSVEWRSSTDKPAAIAIVPKLPCHAACPTEVERLTRTRVRAAVNIAAPPVNGVMKRRRRRRRPRAEAEASVHLSGAARKHHCACASSWRGVVIGSLDGQGVRRASPMATDCQGGVLLGWHVEQARLRWRVCPKLG
jgi:anti-sigma factor RsiW